MKSHTHTFIEHTYTFIEHTHTFIEHTHTFIEHTHTHIFKLFNNLYIGLKFFSKLNAGDWDLKVLWSGVHT